MPQGLIEAIADANCMRKDFAPDQVLSRMVGLLHPPGAGRGIETSISMPPQSLFSEKT